MGIVEKRSIRSYQKKVCGIAELAIDVLNQYKKNNHDYVNNPGYIKENQQVKAETIRWLSQHFKGKYIPSTDESTPS